MPEEIKPVEGSVLSKKDEEPDKVPEYTDEEQIYLSALKAKLNKAQGDRDKVHEEFDNLSYTDYYLANEKGANIVIEAVNNKEESQFQSGTLRTKMMALLSSWTALNMKADITAFNEYEIMINNLGNAMEGIINKTEEYEGDEEQRMLRQYELLKQGFVFVEDMWIDKWQVVKDKVMGVFGQWKGAKWRTRVRKTFGMPQRKILSPLSVYLGDIRQYFLEKQPFIFTVELVNYDDIEPIYRDWEMWKYVSKNKKSLSDTAVGTDNWQLTNELGKGQVEVIKFQDKPHNEFQILLNGVPMLPLGYPLTEIAKDGEYTIAQQNLEPIRHDFAYGKSFIFKNKNIVAVLDMMMKLAVLKTKKSFIPAMLNLSQRLISRDVLMPGRISRGIGKGQIVPVIDQDSQGVTVSEFNMIDKLTQFIDRNTVSQTFTGAKEQGSKVTATQINETQRQAAIMMGLLNLAAGLLEKKLTFKRLGILLDKWFEPLDSVVDEARNMLRNKYRYVSNQATIEDKGNGLRIILAKEEEVSAEQVKQASDSLGKKMGVPIELLVINPLVLKAMKIIWQVTVVPKEKKTSDYAKAMFSVMVRDGVELSKMGVLPPFNRDYMGRRFAEMWEDDPARMFESGQQPVAPVTGTEQPAPVKPQIKVTPQGTPPQGLTK